MRRIPPLNGLRAFEATARHLSFTKAANELCVTQGAVSRHVKNLEDYLGVTLLLRNTRQVALTDAGLSMLAGLTLAFDNIANTTAAVTRQSNDLDLLVSSSFAMLWLIPRLHTFEQGPSHPHIRITTRSGEIDFDSNHFTAGIIYGAGPWPNLEAELLMQEQLVPVCARSLLHTAPHLDSIADLQNHTLLHPSTDHRDWHLWLQANGESSVDPDKGLAFETMDAALRAASSGHGVTISDLSLIKEELESEWLLQPFPEALYTGRGYYFVYPANTSQEYQISAFREWLFAELAGG